MPKFKVSVYRTSYSQKDIIVEADSEDEANDKAIKEAGNLEFSSGNAEYEVDYVEELNEEQ